MDFVSKHVFCLLILVSAEVAINQHLNPSVVFNEGCIDETCLKYLMRDHRRVNKCFDPLRVNLALDEDTGVNMCCAVRKYEVCIFPLIIANCGLDSIDKFEAEMRSMNTICDMTTQSWIRCEPKNTTTEETQLELKEVR